MLIYSYIKIKKIYWFTFLFVVAITAKSTASWQETAYSMAASEMGIVGFYRMEDDLIWRRSDDKRFASYKDLEEPADGEDWWVKTFYRSDGFPLDGNISFSQDYSATLIGHESSLVRQKWGGKLYEGAFYTMTSSNAYINAYDGKPVEYGGGSNAMTSYGGALYTVWAGAQGKRFESVFRVANIQSTMTYTRSDGTGGMKNARLWMPSLGLRYYDMRVSQEHRFFWEPQVGISAGYVRLRPLVDADTSFRATNPFIVTGRVGIMAGRAYSLQGHNGLAYGRVDMQRNLSGPLEGEATNQATQDQTKVTLGEGQTTWYDMTVGTSVALGKGNLLWGEYTKRFGSHMDTTWNVTGGLVVKWGGASRKEKEDFEKLKEDPRSLKTQF